MDLIVFPDAEASAIRALNDRLAEVGFAGVEALSKIPNPRPSSFVRVLRAGGARVDRVIDQARLLVEGWAEDDEVALQLTQAARAIVNGMEGSVVGGVTIYQVEELSGPGYLPDPESLQERYTFTTNVSCRGKASTV